MKPPLITIAMPIRNCEKTIAPAVRSVLNQNFQDWELLVICDVSTDGTLAELNRFQDGRIKVLHDNHSKGLPASLNEAIDLAKGEFFARMDGDDVSYPKRLELQLDYLRSHPEVDLVGGGVLVFEKEGRALGKRMPPENHQDICRKPYAGFPMSHPTYFGKTAWFRRYGYRESAILCEDQDLLLRAFQTSHFANLPQVVLGYREQLDLMRILRNRRFWAGIVLKEYSRNGQLVIGWRGVLGQYLKSLVDIVAVVTGLKYHLLRHRAMPAGSEEVLQWQQVWRTVSGSESSKPSA